MLPAYTANTIPVVVNRWNILNCLALPIDRGKKLRGEPILGSHVTLRGFLLGSLGGIFTACLQSFFFSFPYFSSLSLIDYSQIDVFFLGFLLSFGALLGDCSGSFFKRRRHKKKSEPWIPGDQIGLALGALILIAPFYSLPWLAFPSIIVVTFFWHITAARTAYILKIRKEKW